MLPDDWESETPLSPEEAAERLEVCRQTVYAWFATGRRVKGRLIKLEYVRKRGLKTSVEAVHRFIARCSRPETEPQTTRTLAEQNRAAQAAAERLRAKDALRKRRQTQAVG